VYQRAKNINDTAAFGTLKDVYGEGYEYLAHSLWPKKVKTEELRYVIGEGSCREPYSASRFNISAMSYGALSTNAVLALNKGAKYGDFYHNTGEGAISDWHLENCGDLVWNIGTGYFGCRDPESGQFNAEMFAERAALPQVKMIEVKLSQGAKPAHGGMLPAGKISPEISRIRGVPMGKDVHSPPTHSAFQTPVELMKFMAKLREISGKPVGFKICVGDRVEMMALIRAAYETDSPPDFITVDGGEGGTGAAPREFSNSVGTPMRDALAFVHDGLVGAGLRHRVAVICSGKIVTGTDMTKAFALGADVCNAARSFLFSLGCIQALSCNTNKCPTGITTQDPKLVRGLVVEEKWKRVYLYHKNTMSNMAEVVGSLGLESPTHVRREQIMRRENNEERRIQSFLVYYPRVMPRVLLQGTGPQTHQNAWDKAGDLLNAIEGGVQFDHAIPPYLLDVEVKQAPQA
jgi:glutamate synthase domain-containing protein 2